MTIAILMKRRLLLWTGLVGLPVCFFNGCLPLPHRQKRLPQIAGQVFHNGSPWGGVPVTLSYQGSDGKRLKDQATRAMADGFFGFQAASEFKFFMTLGDRFDAWEVCFGDPGHARPCWKDRALWGGPAGISLTCQIQDQNPATVPETLPTLESLPSQESGCLAQAGR